MKQVRIGAVYYQILVELAKKNKKNIESYLADLVSSEYGRKK